MSDSQGKTRRTLVQINPDDSLPEVLTRLRSFAGKSIDLDIPDHSPILLTATEFRTLKDAAQRSQINLNLKTEDRLRIQLASMFDLIDGVSISRRGRDASRGGGDLAAPYGGWRPADEAVKPEDNDPISISRRRRNAMERTRLDESPPKSSRSKSKTSADESGSLDYLDKEDGSGGFNARLLGRLVAIFVVIVLIAGIAGWYYMPEVAISAKLKEQQVNGELIYAVGLPGGTLPSDVQFQIDAEESSADIRISFSVPTTGGVVEPDATATGSVVLRNPDGTAVNVPAGTTMQTIQGVTFATTAAVDVPAASGETPGETRVDVTASEPGSAGNVELGALTGKLDDLNIFYSNREAEISGGTDRQILEVTQEDIDNLETTLGDQIKKITADGWSRQLDAGQTLVAPSVTPGEPEYEIGQNVGDQVEEVSLTGTVEATGLVYSQQDIDGELKTKFQEEINPTVPAGFGLLVNTIALGEASVVSEQPTAVIYRQAATATAQAIYDSSSQSNLVEMLSGKDYDNAEAIVQGQTAFETSSIDISPGFWPKRMPQTGDRIDLTIEPGSEQLPEIESTPDASPEGTS